MSTAIVFVARIRQGKRDQLARLLADGPPFDPAAAGFERHAVYLGEEEVAFVFRSDDPVGDVKRLSAEHSLLRQTLRMAGLVHPPRLLREAYVWDGSERAAAVR